MEKPNKEGKKKSAKKCLENSNKKIGYKMCLLKFKEQRNELNIMVVNIDLHIIGITESQAITDISDAELGYIMFTKDKIGRRGGGISLYINKSIQAYEIKLEKEPECEEAVWYNIVTGNSTLTCGLVYRSPNISIDENEKVQKRYRGK